MLQAAAHTCLNHTNAQCHHLKCCMKLKAPHCSHHVLLFGDFSSYCSVMTLTSPPAQGGGRAAQSPVWASCLNPVSHLSDSLTGVLYTPFLTLLIMILHNVIMSWGGQWRSFPVFQESYISILNSFTLLSVLGFIFTVLEGGMSTGDTVRIHKTP